jgi:hypothetical protein
MGVWESKRRHSAMTLQRLSSVEEPNTFPDIT